MKLRSRRSGDPAASVAANERIGGALGCTPQYGNLDEVARQALEWEKRRVARGGV
ncbi:MAG: hypothetical protein ACR65U_04475 [Methylocystis sp.]